MVTSSTSIATGSAHSVPASEFVELLESSVTRGLSESEARDRLRVYGRNAISHSEKYSAWRTFAHQLRDPQMLLLFSAAALSFSVSVVQRPHGLPVEALFIAAVGTANALLGFVQEHRAHQAMEALRLMTPLITTVLRDGRLLDVPAETIVPGDILSLHEGCIVPADARVLQSSSLRLMEASLTGESGSVSKSSAELPFETVVADRSDMVFNGTVVLTGTGRAVVSATGDATELGKIAQMVQSTAEVVTPLQKQIASLSKGLAIFVVILAVIFSTLLVLQFHIHTLAETVKIVLFSVSLAVAASPEALATIVTLTLALAAHKLALHGAIVRKMSAIETLGRTNVILCDKTGTVTVNQLTVQDAIPACALFQNCDDGMQPQQLFEAAALASVDLEGAVDRRNSSAKDPVDRAIWVHAEHCLSNLQTTLGDYKIVHIEPFTSDRKMMSVLASKRAVPDELYLFTKGAPEVLLELCNTAAGLLAPFTPAQRQYAKDQAAKLASEGLKVIAAASRACVPVSVLRSVSEFETNLTFLGFIALADPVRKDAALTIRQAAAAGVRTVLLTGDHPRAAVSTAKTIGIPNADRVLTGIQLDTMTDTELSFQLRDGNILARVTPFHKLRVAKLLQSQGDIVAMTGDGVNDAPALKQADVGIALGGGTDLAKQSADVILTDDDIATIFRGITEGRRVFNNVRKAVFYLFSSNLSEVLTMSGIVVLGLSTGSLADSRLDLPLTTEQILWINLITDTIPALALSFSNAKEPWRSNSQGREFRQLLNRPQVIQILAYSVAMTCATLVARALTRSDQYAYVQTVTVTTLVISQALFSLTLWSQVDTIFRSAREMKHLLLAVAAVLLLQAILPETAFGQAVMGMAPLTINSFSMCLVLSSVPLLVSEAAKVARRGSRNRNWPIGTSGQTVMRVAG